jgi:hypothetical protein
MVLLLRVFLFDIFVFLCFRLIPYFNVSSPCDSLQCSIILGLTYILDKESNKKKLNTPVKENYCKNLFQTPISNQNEGNDFENDEIQMELTVMHLPYLVKLDGTTPSCIFI